MTTESEPQRRRETKGLLEYSEIKRTSLGILKDLEIIKAKGLFGSLATKYNYIPTDLPSEIICDIVSLPRVNKKVIVGFKGPFRNFAKNPSDN
ncbi:hypothetical protein L596_001791 [Steinernema carpocapsae]|uniref:Uncharacterized protein n=1 Tax=Steinernema carpocapsae TaxID=34508 RepID=A0A4U8UMT0_STECR|nr:hypothetical protein L596_001791 [Steinernema carpocapsae]